MAKVTENWASGDAYEFFMGRWSREIAKKFVRWLNTDDQHQHWIDIGCGTGALSNSIQETVSPKMILGLDASFDFLRYARQSSSLTDLLVSDAQAIGITSNTFDVIVTGLALNFVPQPELALKEMTRIAKSKAIISAYVWDYAGKMEFLKYFWDAVVALNPDAQLLHEGYRFPICTEDALSTLWHGAELENIVVEAIDVITPFDNFEQYWELFTTGSFPAPHYVASLDTKSQNDLRDYLKNSLPYNEDGSIELIARAWAVRGIKPSE